MYSSCIRPESIRQALVATHVEAINEYLNLNGMSEYCAALL